MPERNMVATKLLMENEKVRIWEMRLQPGERGELHKHHFDHILVQISGDRMAVEPDPSTKSSTEVWASGAPRHLLPENVRIGSEVAVEVRAKGIYSVPVYVSKIVITGEFDPHAITDIARSHAAASERWSVTAGTGRASAKPLSRRAHPTSLLVPSA